MESNSEINLDTNIIDQNSHSIQIQHRGQVHIVNYNDFSSKSSYKEVIGLPHSFDIEIDDILETDSVDALIQHIKTQDIKEIINENNVLDLNFLAHLYGFYLLQAATGPFLLSQVPINRVFETFEKRKSVQGYVQSFSYYFTHNFDTFVCDPSFYFLPFNVIENMLDKNASKLTADDIIQFTINTYYSYGEKALSLLEKANKCKSKDSNENIKNDTDRTKSSKNAGTSELSQNNILNKLVDSDENSNSKSDQNINLNNNEPNQNSNDNQNNNDNDNNLNLISNDDSLSGFLPSDNNNNNTNSNYSNTNAFNGYYRQSRIDSTDNFSVKYNSSSSDLSKITSPTKRVKRSGKILEKDASTQALVRLYATISHDRPYPYTQYIVSLLKQRNRPPQMKSKVKQIEELRYNISSLYIALLETTQGNKSAAHILLASFYETGKIEFMSNKELFTLYHLLSEIPPPKQSQKDPSTSAGISSFKTFSAAFSLSFSDIDLSSADLDPRLLRDDFDWGAHGFFMLYRIYQEGLFNCPTDPRKAQAYLKQSADRGYREAYFKLAAFIISSPEFPNIKDDRLDALQHAADFGNGDYQYAMGCSLSERKDKLANNIKAVHYFKLAMLSGHPIAESSFNKLQCEGKPATLAECTKAYQKAFSDKQLDFSSRLKILRNVADCGFEQAIIKYPIILSREDCSSFNENRPMGIDMQLREVTFYFRYAMKRDMKRSHVGLAIFLLRNLRSVEGLDEVMKIIEEGCLAKMADAILIKSRLFLRFLGPAFRDKSKALEILLPLASASYPPALIDLAKIYLYGVDGTDLKPDISFAMSFLNQLRVLKEPRGTSRFLYMMINDPQTPKQKQTQYINELKAIADIDPRPATSQFQEEEPKELGGHVNEPAALPLWLYAKVLLEGVFLGTDFKAAVSYLKRAPDFSPAQALLISLSFQFGGIIKKNFSSKIRNFIKFNSSSSSQAAPNAGTNIPRNFDSSVLPLPSAVNNIIKKFATQNDPTFRYKLGSIMLDEDELSEVAFEHIRQSAYSGSICGMVKYGLLRLTDQFRPINEVESLEMFKKAAEQGFDAAAILYASRAMRYEGLRRECLDMLRAINLTGPVAGQTANFVSGGGRSNLVEANRLKLSLGECLCEIGDASLEESQYHLSSIINDFKQQYGGGEDASMSSTNSNNASMTSTGASVSSTSNTGQIEIKIGQSDYAEALYYYAKTIQKKADIDQFYDPNDADVALISLRDSFINGYKPAGQAYINLLISLKKFDKAVEFLLDNVSTSTFALYKIGSLVLFDRTSLSTPTIVSVTQAIDFMKIATMLDDSNDYPDALWKFGTMLRDGSHVAKNEVEALNLFYRAAEHGSEKAVMAIGSMALKIAIMADPNDKSTFSVASQNLNTAFNCFSNAASVESREGKWCRAMCLLNGIGCKRNVAEAVKVLRLLTDIPDKDVIYKLGKIAYNASKAKNGKCHFALLKLGMKMILEAAEFGHSTALWRVGLFVLQGKITKSMASGILKSDKSINIQNKSDEEIAYYLFKRSAEIGNKRGAQLLSLCLENGIGVERNEELARVCISSNIMDAQP